MTELRFTAALLVGALCLAPAAAAQAPTAPPKGEAVLSSVQVTATVTKVDQQTREVTLKTPDGQEHSFVAGDEVKNLAQVNVGDLLTVTYTEALAYEVKKGGQATGAAQAVAAGAAALGEKPAAGVARQATMTVTIVAIDPTIPTVTFRAANGTTRTIKVRYPEKLQGVSVGDTVELTYTEALLVKVEEAVKQ